MSAPRQGSAGRRARARSARDVPAHRQVGPSYLAQRKAGHLLRKFGIVCFEPLERTQPSVGRPNSKGSKRYQFVNLYLQVPSSKNRAHRQGAGNVQYFKGDWTYRYEMQCPRTVARRKTRCAWNSTPSKRLRRKKGPEKGSLANSVENFRFSPRAKRPAHMDTHGPELVHISK